MILGWSSGNCFNEMECSLFRTHLAETAMFWSVFLLRSSGYIFPAVLNHRLRVSGARWAEATGALLPQRGQGASFRPSQSFLDVSMSPALWGSSPRPCLQRVCPLPLSYPAAVPECLPDGATEKPCWKQAVKEDVRAEHGWTLSTQQKGLREHLFVYTAYFTLTASPPGRLIIAFYLPYVFVCLLVSMHTKFMQAPTQKRRSDDPPDVITGN